MNKLGTKLGAIAMSAIMAVSFAPSAVITTLAAGSESTPAASELSVPVYRLYNPNNGEHLFTQDAKECEWLQTVGWTYERVAWYAPTEGEMVYRLNNPNHPLGDHLYTSNPNEVSDLLGLGWTQDETFFYAASADDLLASPVYRLYNPNAYDQGLATHHWTLDSGEIGGLTTAGWNDEGTKFYEYEEDIDPVGTISVEIDNDTPKVGDTLTAIVTGAAAASYEWAVSVDGEDWDAIESEDDDTFAVTADLVGMYVKVTVTAEDGETDSDVTKDPVKEAGTLDIVSAEVTAANEITVTFADAVDEDDLSLVVEKGSASVDSSYLLDDEGLTAVITTTANLSEGTYKVTATLIESGDSDAAYVEVEGQKVDKIVINETGSTQALTNADATKAYASYDVYDQFGNSMRSSATINWNASCEVKADKSTGTLTFSNSDGSTFRYGDLIVVTGVYTGMDGAVTGQATLTAGLEQAVDSLDIAGFVKTGTNEIVQTVPIGFKSDEYHMVFLAYDQNGALLDSSNVYSDTDTVLTFVSDNPIVISKIELERGTVTADGVTYAKALLTPGAMVKDGGIVNIQAIAAKTGHITPYTTEVGEQEVVASFVLSTPSVDVADGDQGVEIPFTAKNQWGGEVTDFVTIARQKTLNSLTFSAGDSHLVLKEEDDGSAGLYFYDKVFTWGDSTSTDGINRMVSLTSIVVGGNTSNVMLSIGDKRRPNAIKEVDMDKAYVEGNTATLELESFTYIDQYNQDMDTDDALAFFAWPTLGGNYTGTGFKDYHFGVKGEYKGNGFITSDLTYAGTADTAMTKPFYLTVSPDEILDKDNTIAENKSISSKATVTLSAAKTVNKGSAKTGEAFKFTIAKGKPTADSSKPNLGATSADTISSSYNFETAVVDIEAVKGFAIGGVKDRLYLGETRATGIGVANSAVITAPEKLDDSVAIENTLAVNDKKGLANDVPATGYAPTVTITGKWNGNDVEIPSDYFKVTGSKIKTTTGDYGDDKINTLTLDEGGHVVLKYSDLYEKTSANFVAKDATDKLEATIGVLYWNSEDEISDAIAATTTPSAIVATVGESNGYRVGDLRTDADPQLGGTKTYDTAALSVLISDQNPEPFAFKDLAADVVNPTQTEFAAMAVIGTRDVDWSVVDQYGVANDTPESYRLTNIEEADAYAENNFTVSGNNTIGATVTGAERGDTFTLVVSIDGTSLSAELEATVGADTRARIQDSDNFYLDVLVNGVENHAVINGVPVTTDLETQRLATLG